MDRFIASLEKFDSEKNYILKSNMDRFIAVCHPPISAMYWSFKIQYGQIYRTMKVITDVIIPNFKIQYGQIYRIRAVRTQERASQFKIQYGQIYSVPKVLHKFRV